MSKVNQEKLSRIYDLMNKKYFLQKEMKAAGELLSESKARSIKSITVDFGFNDSITVFGDFSNAMVLAIESDLKDKYLTLKEIDNELNNILDNRQNED